MKTIKTGFLLAGLALFVQLLLPALSPAKLYTWTDRNGIVRRTYYPPPADQVWKDKSPGQNAPIAQPAEKKQVELYVTSWCPSCKKAIEFFQAKGVPVTIYDVEKDRDAAARKKKLTSRTGVPFAVVNGRKILGYAPAQYVAALALQQNPNE